MAAHYAPEQPPNPQWFLTRMTEMFRKCLAPTRGVELSTWVSRLFVAAFIIPWVVFAWMTLQERADVLRRLDDNRAALAATYGEHAAQQVAAVASLNPDRALADWRQHAKAAFVALVLRSLFVILIGLFLVEQLSRREFVEAELVKAKDAAEAANRAKSAFLANMSHELRTPLNAILGFSEIIKSGHFGPASERYSAYAGDIYNSGKHLLSLINDILNLSKLEAGQLALDEQEVDIRAVIAESVRFIEACSRKAGVRVIVHVENGIPLLWADERRLQQVLINLLSNAVKFTPRGGQVCISALDSVAGVTIAVSDTGIGIAPEDIPKVLAPFGQVASALSRNHEGTGLGLTLAKQLAELHGGTLAIEIAPGAGTTVTIVLPPDRIVVDAAPVKAPAAAQSA